jgi:hypothetical protein
MGYGRSLANTTVRLGRLELPTGKSGSLWR